MYKNKKFMLLALTLFLIFVSITSINATDVDDTQETTTDMVASIEEISDFNVETLDNKVDKIVEAKDDKLSTSQTINVDNSNFSSVFTTSGLSGVNDGDKVILTESVTSESSVVIDKAINLTSANNAVLSLNTISGNYFGNNPGNSFSITSAGSFTNITSFHFYNTQVFVKGANNVTFDDVTVEVRNQQIGSGVGVTSIREGSSFITIKNSNFITEKNGGSSSLVLADVNYCSIENNTITGIGNVGNLLYLTTYNVNTIDLNNVETNSFNNITANTITGPSSSAICMGIVLTGHDNRVESNTINYAGTAISTQWMGNALSEEAVGDYDQRYIGNDYISNIVTNGGNVICGLNSTITANTFSGNLNTGANSTVTNNQITGKLNLQANASASSNTVGGITSLYENTVLNSNTITNKVNVVGTNVIINNNTIRNKISVNKSNVLVNNSRVNGDITVKSGCTNVSVTNNQYTGSITGATYEYNNTWVNSIENIGLTRSSKINNDKLSANETVYLTPENVEDYVDFDYEDRIAFYHGSCRGKTIIIDDEIIEMFEGRPIAVSYLDLTLVQAPNSTLAFSGLYIKELPEGGFNYTRHFINMTFEHVIKNKRSRTHFIDANFAGLFDFQNCTFNINVTYYPTTVLENALIEAVEFLDNTTDIKIFNNCTFNMIVPGSTIDWVETSSQKVVPIRLSGDQVIFTNNKVNITQYKHDQEGNYPTDYVIMIKDSALVENNTFVITSETELGYLYALDFVSASNCTVRGNDITVIGSKYTNGIYFTGTYFGNNTIENNFINLTSGFNLGTSSGGGIDYNFNGAEDSGYGIVLEDRFYMGGTYREDRATVNDNRIINNTIYATGNNVYGIESFGSNNTVIENNTIVATGYTPKAIGVISSNLIVKGNDITVNGTNISGTTADYIPAMTSGMIVSYSTNAEITNNTIDVITGPGIIFGGYNQSNVTNNLINTNNNYTVTLTNSNYINVVNNTLYAKTLKGYESVNNSGSNNIIEDNLPKDNLIDTYIELMPGLTNIKLGRNYSISGYFAEVGKYTGQAAIIKVYVDDVEEATLNLGSWGTIYYTFVANSVGEHKVRFVFEGNDTHNGCENTYNITVIKNQVVISVDNITAQVYNNVSITAKVVDENSNPVTGGRVSFKVNGNYLKDADGNYIYVKVINGSATTDLYLKYKYLGENTISAVFGGNSIYDVSRSDDASLTVEKADVIVSVDNVSGTVNQTVIITARVTDSNGNNVSGGRLSLKVNGNYLKDANGNYIYANVINGIATIEYIAPVKWIDSNSTITAHYWGNKYYNRASSDSSSITISKQLPTIWMDSITTPRNSTVNFVVNLTGLDNTPVNMGRVGFKVNDVTLKDATGEVIHVNVAGGIANITVDVLDEWNQTNNITIIYGGCTFYESVRAYTTMTILE